MIARTDLQSWCIWLNLQKNIKKYFSICDTGVESAGTDLQSWCIWLQARHTNTFPVEWWEDNNKNVSILWDENCTYAPLYLCSESHWFLCNIYGPSDNHKFLDFMLASICHLGDDQCVAMGDRQTHPISHTETHTQTHRTHTTDQTWYLSQPVQPAVA